MSHGEENNSPIVSSVDGDQKMQLAIFILNVFSL